MTQYNAKIDYYQEFVVRKLNCEDINIYLPIREMKNIIDKFTISYYDRIHSTPHPCRKSQSKPPSKKSMYPSRINKENLMETNYVEDCRQ